MVARPFFSVIFAHHIHDPVLVPEVEMRGWFIEQQDRSILEKCPRQQHQLPLPAAQLIKRPIGQAPDAKVFQRGTGFFPVFPGGKFQRAQAGGSPHDNHLQGGKGKDQVHLLGHHGHQPGDLLPRQIRREPGPLPYTIPFPRGQGIPFMHLSSVVLPEAFGPSSPQRDPRPTSNVISRKNCFFAIPETESGNRNQHTHPCHSMPCQTVEKAPGRGRTAF